MSGGMGLPLLPLLFSLLTAPPSEAQPGIAACVPGGGYDHFPFCNTSLHLNDRVWDLIRRINDTDKPELLTARGHMSLPTLGVPNYYWGHNCIHSVQFSNCTSTGKCATSFPSGPSVAATFDRDVIRDMAGVIGVEMRAGFNFGNWTDDGKNGAGLDCWGPVVNINRDPRWGRNGEGGTEDPYLMGQLGLSWTQGLQVGDDPRYLLVAVTLKHFVANSVEARWSPDGRKWGNDPSATITRHNVDVNVSKYLLQDYYWPAFRTAIRDGNAQGIMCSYNSVNGVPSCLDPLQHAARKSWDFDGYVTSDTDSVDDAWEPTQHRYVPTPEEASCLAIRDGGCDIDSGNTYYKNLLNGVDGGECTMKDVDRALFNSLRVRFRLGLFDPTEAQPYWQYGEDDIATPQSRSLNLLLALESLVLLRNPGNILPLTKGRDQVTVVGPYGDAHRGLIQIDGGMVCPSGGFDCVTSPFEAIRDINGMDKTTYRKGCGIISNDTSKIGEAVEEASRADIVVLALGISSCWGKGRQEDLSCRFGNGDGSEFLEAEAHDRRSIGLPPAQDVLARNVIGLGKPTVIVLFNGGSVALKAEYLNAPNVAVVEAFYPGQTGGVALALSLFGLENRWGKMPYTVYPAEWTEGHNMLDHDVTTSKRTYRYGADALVPFGWGLSLTEFKLDLAVHVGGEEVTRTATTVRRALITNTISLSSDGTSPDVMAMITVWNVGTILVGDEVIQAYFSPKNVPGLELFPNKSLFGFERVREVHPSSSKTTTFVFNTKDLLLVTEDGDRVSEPGTYDITFETGNSMEPLSLSIEIVGDRFVVEHFPLPKSTK